MASFVVGWKVCPRQFVFLQHLLRLTRTVSGVHLSNIECQMSNIKLTSRTSIFDNMRSSGTQTYLTDSSHGNLTFRRVVCLRFRSGFSFQSDFYIRDSGGIIRPPVCVTWGPCKGRFHACHYGCQISFPGRPLRSRLAWQVSATYVTWRCGFHSFHGNTLFTRLQNRRKLLLESMAKLRLLRQAN